jgi:hypothetical protein
MQIRVTDGCSLFVLAFSSYTAIIKAMHAYLFLVQAEMGLLVSPPANDRSALAFVPAHIRASVEVVATVGKTSSARESTNENDGVGADIVKPDGLVVDGINDLTRVEPTSGTIGK